MRVGSSFNLSYQMKIPYDSLGVIILVLSVYLLKASSLLNVL